MKNNKAIAKFLTIFFILIQTTCLAACSQTAQPSPTATQAQSTQTPSPSPTATLTATPPPTDTPEPTATITPTVPPSPIPPGFLKLTNGGFSFTYPFDWKVESQTSNDVSVFDKTTGQAFIAASQPASTDMTIYQMIDAFKSSFPKGETIKTIQTGQVNFGDGTTAQTVDVTMTMPTVKISGELAYAHRGIRDYLFTFMCPFGELILYQPTLQTIYSSIHLFTPEPFGLPHDQTLVMLGDDPTAQSLDPAVTNSSAADYVGLLFSGLVRLTPQLQIVPDLAQKWTVSSDGEVYTFTLLPNLKFSNGTALTAQSVKDSWERACDPKTGSLAASTYLGDILGVKEKLAGKANTIQGLKVIDDLTLEVTLDGAKAYFLAKLTYPTAAVIDVNDAVQNPTKWMFNPSSSGPYMVKEYTPKQDIIFQANPNYPVQPKVSYLAFMFDSGGNPISLYQEGTIDMLPLTSDEVSQYSKPNGLSIEVHTAPVMCTSMITLNTNKAPLDDINVRKALAMAIDKTGFVNQLGSASFVVTNSILPPAMPGYLANQAGIAFDPAGAKAVLQNSNYAGKILTLTMNAPGTGGTQRQDVALLTSMLKNNLGININVQYLDPNTYTSSARKNPGNIILYSWCADYPDPENFLDVLFNSKSDFNISKLNNPSLDSLLESAGTEQDGNKRLQLYQQAEAILLKDVDVIPIMNEINGILVKSRIQGFVLPPLGVSTLPWLSISANSN